MVVVHRTSRREGLVEGVSGGAGCSEGQLSRDSPIRPVATSA
jgi:hypothetical protein